MDLHPQRGTESTQARLLVRARGERAIATLKNWKILAKLRCCPRRATSRSPGFWAGTAYLSDIFDLSTALTES